MSPPETTTPHGPVVTHVCAVGTLHADAGTVGVTAIDKRPVPGPVRVGRHGLRGDVQADRAHHGGPDKALYAFDEAEADYWAGELGGPVWPGRFGENLRLRGLAVDDAVIGERWRIGAQVEVEVTMPRTPCATFGRWVGRSGWVARFTEHGRTGAYLRVLTAGPIGPGDPVAVTARPAHGVTVTRWFTGRDPQDARALLDHEAAVGWVMAGDLRRAVVRAAGPAHR